MSNLERKPKPGDRYRIIDPDLVIHGHVLKLERFQEGSPTPYIFVYRQCQWYFPPQCVQKID